MQFLLKLFKALNSAQTPWQVTLAIALGMVAGLTPLSGIQSVIIFFLAFLLNIHLGLFFVASALFAGVGYLLDPWFEQIGFALLTNEGLSGLRTAWYNNGLLRLSYFNNTLVLGSSVVALAAAVPLYFLLGWMISHYRDALGSVLARYPRLGLFGVLQASSKKDPLLRWWGAAVFVGLGALVAVIALVVLDPALKWGLQKGASAVLDRDVRIGGVTTHFTEGAVEIRGLEVASDKKGIDALSIEMIQFDIVLNALLLNRTHIEQLALRGVGFDTKATLKKEPHKAEKSVPEVTETGEEPSEIALPAFELPEPKTLLAGADLKSLKVYDEAQKEIDAIKTKWEKISKTEFSSDALSSYQKEFKRIKTQASSKDPRQLLKLKDDVSAFTKKIKERKKRIASLQKEFKADQKRITVLYDDVKKAPKQDFNHLRSTYTLDSDGAMNVVGTLFGDKVKTYVAMARKYYTMLSPYLQSDPESKEVLPPRGSGRWISYPETVPSPDLWIARTQIEGMLKAQSFNASLNDVSDKQKALDRAMTFTLSSDGKEVGGLKISGEDNRLNEVVKDHVTFEAERINMEPFSLASMQVSQSDLAFNGTLELTDGTALAGMSRFDFSNTAINMESLKGKTAKTVNEVLNSVNAFSTDVTLGGRLDAPKISVSSDLDRKLSGAFKAGLKKQAEKYEKELEALLDSQMKERLGALQGSAGSIVDMNALAGSQSKALGSLSGSAGDLLKEGAGSSLKKLLPF